MKDKALIASATIQEDQCEAVTAKSEVANNRGEPVLLRSTATSPRKDSPLPS